MSPIISETSNPDPLRLAIPKGRMFGGVERLLDDAGISLRTSARDYRPYIAGGMIEAKILKPQNLIEMLDLGTRDVGFAGADWIQELGANVIELLDTGLDRVHMVVAAPRSILEYDDLPNRSLTVASEYVNLTTAWQTRRGRQDKFVRSFGSTEVFPPEDADYIIDIAATGATLAANNLVVIEELNISSTRLYASRKAMADTAKAQRIKDFCLVLEAVIEARERVMLEANVPTDHMENVMSIFPAMKQPTISSLSDNAGFAVKAAVKKSAVLALIPALKQAGATDIIITNLAKVVK
jgi:ATP phosphoribosyltransferase